MEINEAKEKLMEFLGFDKDMPIMGVFNPMSFNAIWIQKGRISKSLKKSDYITIYEFKLKKADQLVNSISKRFSEIEQLHHVSNNLCRILKDGVKIGEITSTFPYHKKSYISLKSGMKKCEHTFKV